MGPRDGRSIVDGLLKGNEKGMIKIDGLYNIASWEADQVYVGLDNSSFNSGWMYIIDHEDESRTPQILTTSFENLLIAAANINKLSIQVYDEEMSYEKAEKEIILFCDQDTFKVGKNALMRQFYMSV